MQSVLGQGKHWGSLLSMLWEPQAVQQHAGLGKGQGQGGWHGHSSTGQLEALVAGAEGGLGVTGVRGES